MGETKGSHNSACAEVIRSTGSGDRAASNKGLKIRFLFHFPRDFVCFSPHVVSQTEAGVEIRGGR